MLNFSFTEEQEFFRKMLKDFAKEERYQTIRSGTKKGSHQGIYGRS